MPDFKGFIYDRPDLTKHPELGRVALPDQNRPWGTPVTPDEIRYTWLIGLELVTQNGMYYSDVQIQGIIDMYTRYLSEQLMYDIFPVSRRHRPIPGEQPERTKEPHEVWEDSYDWKANNHRRQWIVDLRRRPVIRVTRWDYRNPLDPQNRILDLTPHMQIAHDTGLLRSNRVYGFEGTMSQLPMRASPAHGPNAENRRQAGGFWIDYVSGHENAADVPQELREVIARYVSCHIMSGYGDGLTAGVANFSVGLGVVHESLGTAISATSALHGARLLEMYKEWIAEFWKTHFRKYLKPRVGGVS